MILFLNGLSDGLNPGNWRPSYAQSFKNKCQKGDAESVFLQKQFDKFYTTGGLCLRAYLGCHNLLDVKFKEFSMTFQDLFKEIQDLLYQLKPERFTHFFFNYKLYYSALLNGWSWQWKNNQWQVTLDKNQTLRSRGFCFTALPYQKYFN